MTSRKETPTYIISDNGTKYVEAVKEYVGAVKVRKFDEEKIKKTTQHQSIEWKFNPPSGPSFWECF